MERAPPPCAQRYEARAVRGTWCEGAPAAASGCKLNTLLDPAQVHHTHPAHCCRGCMQLPPSAPPRHCHPQRAAHLARAVAHKGAVCQVGHAAAHRHRAADVGGGVLDELAVGEVARGAGVDGHRAALARTVLGERAVGEAGARRAGDLDCPAIDPGARVVRGVGELDVADLFGGQERGGVERGGISGARRRLAMLGAASVAKCQTSPLLLQDDPPFLPAAADAGVPASVAACPPQPRCWPP